MACCEDSVPFAFAARRVQLQVHELVHVFENEHVAIKLYDAVIFGQGEGCEFAPAIIETSVIAIVFVYRWEKIVDPLLGDLADVEGVVAFCREGVGVEGY